MPVAGCATPASTSANDGISLGASPSLIRTMRRPGRLYGPRGRPSGAASRWSTLTAGSPRSPPPDPRIAPRPAGRAPHSQNADLVEGFQERVASVTSQALAQALAQGLPRAQALAALPRPVR